MISHSKPLIRKNDFNYISEIIKTSQLAKGDLVNELQEYFSKILKRQYSFAASTGTSALHLGLLALGLKKGNEVIIPSYSCTALLNAIFYVGAFPVLADIDPETMNPGPDNIKKTITNKTKAIILTHTFGFPAKIDEIMSFGIPVIEDCAHALGAKYKDKPAGSLGTISTFSMYATKMIGVGEGGLISTNDKKLADIIKDLTDTDMRNDYKIRYNYNMSDLTAGLALSQIKKLDSFVKKRQKISQKYLKAFSRFEFLSFQKALPMTIPNYYRFIIMTKRAEQIIDFATSRGIICDRAIYKPLHRYLGVNDPKAFPGTEKVWKTSISVPIYPASDKKDIETIISTMIRGFEKHAL